jgi:hypothetical protein
VFRLFSTKPQPAGSTCHGPGQLQLLGLWAIPSTESGPPTTPGHLQPIFSYIDSQAPPPLRVYVHGYGVYALVVCTLFLDFDQDLDSRSNLLVLFLYCRRGGEY